MGRFRTRPVEITAEQWTVFREPPVGVRDLDGSNFSGWVDTIGGPARIWLSDWVIPESELGKFYPCRPDAFAAKYEEVNP